ncbi:MAG: SdpI family protein [Armatimonadota bacterium]
MEENSASSIRPLLIASGCILAIMLIITAVGWVMIPDGQQMVTHTNLQGQPDAYSDKATALLGLPIGTLIMIGVFMLLARLQNLTSVKTIMWIAALTPMVVLQAVGIGNALGRKINVGVVMWGTFGLLLIVIGNYFPKLRMNRVSGIRTPWTLASELSWSKTHRLGGRLTILYGLVMLLGTILLDSAMLLRLILVGGVALVLFLSVYSYTVWRSDPNRTPWLRL